jgi:hypothetical protein
MTGLHALWLPILLSAVIVFVASSLIHMVLPWHKNDYPRMQNEDKVMDALRPLALAPGDKIGPDLVRNCAAWPGEIPAPCGRWNCYNHANPL